MVIEKIWHGQWISICFSCNSKSGKTKIYKIMSDYGGFIGEIKWYAQWRKYAFYPQNNTVYEQDCLKDIAQFLEELKEERR